MAISIILYFFLKLSVCNLHTTTEFLIFQPKMQIDVQCPHNSNNGFLKLYIYKTAKLWFATITMSLIILISSYWAFNCKAKKNKIIIIYRLANMVILDDKRIKILAAVSIHVLTNDRNAGKHFSGVCLSSLSHRSLSYHLSRTQ